MNAYEEIHGVTRKWTKRNVIGMLTNEAYAGDLLTHKSYTVDYLNHVRKKNEGEKEQQYLQDHHPAEVTLNRHSCCWEEEYRYVWNCKRTIHSQ